MRTLIRRIRPRRGEAGLTTAEYAVGTLGVCTVGGLIAEVGKSEWFGKLVQDLLSNIPNIVKGLGIF